MFTILGGILATAFDSFATSHYKKALGLGNNISNSVFKIVTPIGGGIVFFLCSFYFGFEDAILSNWSIIIGIILLAIFKTGYTLLGLYVYKNTKLSDLLPYGNIDKLFIIIFGFFLYQGIEGKQTSLTTLIITLLTIFIVTITTVNLKNIKVPKTIVAYIIQRILSAIITILVGYILLQYSAITYGLISTIFEAIFLGIFAWYTKESFVAIFRQSKHFYKHRFFSVSMGQVNAILSLFIIESAGIIIASLLGFVSIVFNIISMKITLNDSPSKKQIILAFIVITMIGLGYYLK